MPKLVNYSMYRLIQWFDDSGGDFTQGMEKIYERAPMDSKLRKFLVDLLVWSAGDAKLSNDAPNLMLRVMVAEPKKKRDGKSKTPLLDVRNYYTDERTLVPIVEATKVNESYGSPKITLHLHSW